MEHWKAIPDFDPYSVSDHGRVRNNETERILKLSENQYGVVQVGLMQGGEQKQRSVALLVAVAFLPQLNGTFDTPINRDGDRWNNHVHNLIWRPRWYAVKYNRQFRHPYDHPITKPILNTNDNNWFPNTWEASLFYGLVEKDLVESILNRTFVWPTHHVFQMLEGNPPGFPTAI